MPDPIAVVKGAGEFLYDDQGNEYIDAISSWWVTLHGHAHPKIAEALYKQASTIEQVIFAGFTHEPAVQLAENLLPLLPGPFHKIFYSDNGSTSTEVAIKMSLQYWWNVNKEGGTRNEEGGLKKDPVPKGAADSGREEGREKREEGGRRMKVLAFNNSYHGDTFGAMSVSDRSVFTLAFQEKLFEVVFIDPPKKGDSLPDLNWKEFACFIYEPLVQGAGCMQFYEKDGLNALLSKCKEHQVICIADEVMTGFYRTGKLFASEYLAHTPDIICLSKGLTGGTMALGVTACVERIYQAFVTDDKLKTFFHGHSFTANPLACTAAVTSLELLQDSDCVARIERICKANTEFISSIKSDEVFVHTKNHRQLGTILAFEITSGKDEYLNSIGTTITKMALEKGVFIRPLGNTVYIMPPYCISEESLKKVYEVLREVVSSVR